MKRKAVLPTPVPVLTARCLHESRWPSVWSRRG
jgi:hypothetical protein